jgi:hypothetical protein
MGTYVAGEGVPGDALEAYSLSLWETICESVVLPGLVRVGCSVMPMMVSCRNFYLIREYLQRQSLFAPEYLVSLCHGRYRVS